MNKTIKTADLAWMIRHAIDGKPLHSGKCVASMEMDGTITVQTVNGIYTVKITRNRR